MCLCLSRGLPLRLPGLAGAFLMQKTSGANTHLWTHHACMELSQVRDTLKHSEFKVCRFGTNRARAVLPVLTSETRITVSDLPASFCLSPLCDISIGVSKIGSIWEEFFPWLQQGARSRCSSWETRILLQDPPRLVLFRDWQ